MAVVPRLKAEYKDKIRGELSKELGLTNIMEVPTLKKIVVNVGVGDALKDKAVIEAAQEDLAQITGQKPVITLAKKAISGFKLRKGDQIGLKVTLRGNMMWEFLDKLISITFPRTKDFRGVPVGSFDGHGAYTVGVKEQTAFPEIDPTKVKSVRGLEITIVTSSNEDEKARALLAKLGMPFSKDGKKV